MNNGGPVFPINYQFERNDGTTEIQRWEGMSLRDHFAAKALESAFLQFRAGGFEGTRNELAKSCWEMADAMLAERNK